MGYKTNKNKNGNKNLNKIAKVIQKIEAKVKNIKYLTMNKICMMFLKIRKKYQIKN